MTNKTELVPIMMKALRIAATGEFDGEVSNHIEWKYGYMMVKALVELDKRGYVFLMPYGSYLKFRDVTQEGMQKILDI
ncbi:hypothetical protein [Latilactobacillus sakei]|uniref:hypothetical protein n=1 Tax=Latilactobacillus sakei TaxID=1599 RepID=UPI00241F8F4F|nr:hypothetical protein [Latilactobacillus sakei]MDR7924923.1 hypothetical protein [Latilactobacillus sakei subsp. sakei]